MFLLLGAQSVRRIASLHFLIDARPHFAFGIQTASLLLTAHRRLISGSKLFSIKKIIFTPLPSVYCSLLRRQRGFSLFSKRPKAVLLAGVTVFCSLDILWAVTLFACMFAVIRVHKIDSFSLLSINQILLCFAIFQSTAKHSSLVCGKSSSTGGFNIYFPLQLLTFVLEFQTANPHAPNIISQTAKRRAIFIPICLWHKPSHANFVDTIREWQQNWQKLILDQIKQTKI